MLPGGWENTVERDARHGIPLGQATAKPNARGIIMPEMVVATSTWQHPVGNFS